MAEDTSFRELVTAQGKGPAEPHADMFGYGARLDAPNHRKFIVERARQPQSFVDAANYLDATAGRNATVRRMHTVDIDSLGSGEGLHDYAAVVKSQMPENNPVHRIGRMLKEKLGMEKFVPMLRSAMHANIAAVMYAGDGIILKVTDTGFLPNKRMPGVLAPLMRYDMQGLAVEFYPWVDNQSVRSEDVKKMAAELAKHGLKFCANDDRTDNIGKMPSGRLVVLDGNAVEPITPGVMPPQAAVDAWLHDVRKEFGTLYEHVEQNKEAVKFFPKGEPSFEPGYPTICRPEQPAKQTRRGIFSQGGQRLAHAASIATGWFIG